MSTLSESVEGIFGLRGKIGIVTGAGSGLGVEFTIALAIAGADVVVTDINSDGLQKTVEKVKSLGRQALPIVLDVTDESAVQAAVQTTVEHFGRIDILFNSAGIADPVPSLLHEYSSDSWRKVISVDLDGTYYTCKAVLAVMNKQKSGKIINIASMYGLAGSTGVVTLPAYNAAKGAVVNLTRELGLEYAKQNIQVNALCPGFHRTHIGGNLLTDEAVLSAITSFTPMGRIAEPAEIRGSAMFLASSASDFMTGQTLVVDGGCLAK